MQIEQKIANRLIKANKTLSLAESCTGGLLSHRLTNVPGSSGFFKGGIIAYSNEVKCQVLGISTVSLKRFGAVSRTVALAMAKAARRLFACDFSVSITGIAGPSGATLQKPVGLTFIALASKKKTVCQRFLFKGHRQQIKQQAAEEALQMLWKWIL